MANDLLIMRILLYMYASSLFHLRASFMPFPSSSSLSRLKEMYSIYSNCIKFQQLLSTFNNCCKQVSTIVVNPVSSFLTLVYINFSPLSSWQMKHLLQPVSHRAVDDECSAANAFTSAYATFTSANDNLLLDINNSLYYFEVNSVKIYSGMK